MNEENLFGVISFYVVRGLAKHLFLKKYLWALAFGKDSRSSMRIFFFQCQIETEERTNNILTLGTKVHLSRPKSN
jgi:hypothetical protein